MIILGRENTFKACTLPESTISTSFLYLDSEGLGLSNLQLKFHLGARLTATLESNQLN